MVVRLLPREERLLDEPEQHFVSSQELKPGKYTLGMEFTRTGAGPHKESLGTMKLYVNGNLLDLIPLWLFCLALILVLLASVECGFRNTLCGSIKGGSRAIWDGSSLTRGRSARGSAVKRMFPRTMPTEDAFRDKIVSIREEFRS